MDLVWDVSFYTIYAFTALYFVVSLIQLFRKKKAGLPEDRTAHTPVAACGAAFGIALGIVFLILGFTPRKLFMDAVLCAFLVMWDAWRIITIDGDKLIIRRYFWKKTCKLEDIEIDGLWARYEGKKLFFLFKKDYRSTSTNGFWEKLGKSAKHFDFRNPPQNELVSQPSPQDESDGSPAETDSDHKND